MDDDLGLSEREKELKKWNAPYVYREYPKMLYRVTTTAGRFTLQDRKVANESEEAVAAEAGWLTNPDRAHQAEVDRQEAVGVAAAERAWTERQMSAAARAEAAAADAATGRHLGEVPARPKKPRGRPFAKKTPPAPTVE